MLRVSFRTLLCNHHRLCGRRTPKKKRVWQKTCGTFKVKIPNQNLLSLKRRRGRTLLVKGRHTASLPGHANHRQMPHRQMGAQKVQAVHLFTTIIRPTPNTNIANMRPHTTNRRRNARLHHRKEQLSYERSNRWLKLHDLHDGTRFPKYEGSAVMPSRQRHMLGTQFIGSHHSVAINLNGCG